MNAKSWLAAAPVTRIGAPMFLLLGTSTAVAALATVWMGTGVPPSTQPWLVVGPLVVGAVAASLARSPGRVRQPEHGRAIATASVAVSITLTLVMLGIAVSSDPVTGRWLMGAASTIDLLIAAVLGAWALRNRTP